MSPVKAQHAAREPCTRSCGGIVQYLCGFHGAVRVNCRFRAACVQKDARLNYRNRKARCDKYNERGPYTGVYVTPTDKSGLNDTTEGVNFGDLSQGNVTPLHRRVTNARVNLFGRDLK